MVAGYHQSAATLNLLRAFTKGGFADLAQVHTWNQEFVASSPEGRRYEAIATEIERALRFMAACGVDLATEEPLHGIDFWTSLEGFFDAHAAEGTWPGGVHLEFTGDDVTECIGGSEELREDQLDTRYMTLCDPRLNARQALDLAFRVAELMRG